jgi:ABC-type multidrug transport system ATPase subunit
MTDKPTLLTMHSVTKRYGARDVLCIDRFRLFHGDCILLTGANSSGKSTFLRVLSRIATPSTGLLVWAPDSANINIGYIPQTGGLYADLTLRQNLIIYSRLVGAQSVRQPEDAWFIRDTSLRSYMDTRVEEMSGGIRQMATFACVLSAGPHALVLDEPTSELDHLHARQVYECLSILKRALSFVILSSHESQEFEFITRWLVMRDGRLVL